VLAPPQAVPKTSSGKIRRAASRELYEQGRIGAHAASVGWQLARLAGAGLRAQGARGLRRGTEVLYAAWFWGIFGLAALPLWLLVVLTPGVPRRRRLARRLARGLAFVTGLRLAADFWRADIARARLLLEGGPSFGSEGHLRFVDEIAAVLAEGAPGGRRPLPTRALSLLVAGLGIELGRVIVARPTPDAEIEELIRMVRRSLPHLDLVQRPGRRS